MFYADVHARSEVVVLESQKETAQAFLLTEFKRDLLQKIEFIAGHSMNNLPKQMCTSGRLMKCVIGQVGRNITNLHFLPSAQ